MDDVWSRPRPGSLPTAPPSGVGSGDGWRRYEAPIAAPAPGESPASGAPAAPPAQAPEAAPRRWRPLPEDWAHLRPEAPGAALPAPVLAPGTSALPDAPLSGSACGKLLLFVLLLLPAVLAFGVGALALLFVAFGLVMAHRARDASHIEAAARNVSATLWLAVAGALVMATGLLIAVALDPTAYEADDALIGAGVGFALAGVAFLYVLATRRLFLRPLLSHRDWIARHGLALRDRAAEPPPPAQVPILGSMGLATYSVADELAKWVRLRDDGHVTPEEFAGARRSLLGADAPAP